MHEAYIGGRFRRKKITRKATDVAENLQLYRVVRFFHPRCTTMHISVDIQRITLNALCMTISGGRTKQLDIFCCVTGFSSDFLSFIVVELIRFFHGTLQLLEWYFLQAGCSSVSPNQQYQSSERSVLRILYNVRQHSSVYETLHWLLKHITLLYIYRYTRHTTRILST